MCSSLFSSIQVKIVIMLSRGYFTLTLLTVNIISAIEDPLFSTRLFKAVAKRNIGHNFVMSPEAILSDLISLYLTHHGEISEGLEMTLTQNTTVQLEEFEYRSNRYYIPTYLQLKQYNQRLKEGLIFLDEVHFHSQWNIPFNVSDSIGDFHYNSTVKIKNQFMHTHGEFLYESNKQLDARVIEIPFAGSENIAFLVVLPNKLNGLAELESKMDNIGKLNLNSTAYVQLRLPLFTVENILALRKPLQLLGITKLFSHTVLDKQRLTSFNQFASLSVVEHSVYKPRAVSTSSGMQVDVNFTVDKSFYFEVRSPQKVFLAGH